MQMVCLCHQEPFRRWCGSVKLGNHILNLGDFFPETCRMSREKFFEGHFSARVLRRELLKCKKTLGQSEI
jgi:hypothetical protein